MQELVLLVDDDPKLLMLVEHELREDGLETVSAQDGGEALRLLADLDPQAVVLDLMLPDMSGQDLLRSLKQQHPRIPVVMLTAQADVDHVVECMSLGAVDYVPKPFDRTRLITSVRNALREGRLRSQVRSLTKELRSGDGFQSLLGESRAFGRAIDLLRRAAGTDATVLLHGESGTGKEVAARAVHAESGRREGPFVAVNCGALPEGLIESELFGHEKGAFTGATAARPGYFEQAEAGTLLLDEIGELRTDLQVKLLRVLQERTVQRVGGTRPRAVDVRVLAATNRDLRAEADAKRFREDLYYRLAVFPVLLPSLREREGDALLLGGAFLRSLAEKHGRELSSFTPDAARAIEAYAWPGNVRELENVIERSVLLEDGGEVGLGSLPDEVIQALEEGGAVLPAGDPREAEGGRAEMPSPPTSDSDVIEPLEAVERRLVQRALQLTGGNVTEAAARLGIGRATMYRKIERYGFQEEGRSTHNAAP